MMFTTVYFVCLLRLHKSSCYAVRCKQNCRSRRNSMHGTKGQILPLFRVIQLHRLGPSSLFSFTVGRGTGLGKVTSLLSVGGAIKWSANEIFCSNEVEESAIDEESVEFWDRDNDREDKERGERVLWSPIGWTFFKFLENMLVCFDFSRSLRNMFLVFSRGCFLAYCLDILDSFSKEKTVQLVQVWSCEGFIRWGLVIGWSCQ